MVSKIVQNRKKLIDLFIGYISDVVVHEISDKAIDDSDISERYQKEIKIGLDKALQYRKKINPVDRPLPTKDIKLMKDKIINRTIAELKLRISKGYKNIDLGLVEELVEMVLKDMKIS